MNTTPIEPVALQNTTDVVNHIFILRRRGKIFAQEKFFYDHVQVNVTNKSQQNGAAADVVNSSSRRQNLIRLDSTS